MLNAREPYLHIFIHTYIHAYIYTYDDIPGVIWAKGMSTAVADWGPSAARRSANVVTAGIERIRWRAILLLALARAAQRLF